MGPAHCLPEFSLAPPRLPRGWLVAAWLLPIVALAACGSSRGTGPTDPAIAAVLPPGTDPVVFDTTEIRLERAEGPPVLLTVAVADTIERRTRGLMYRTYLQPDSGMLFAFPIETNSPFWNKNTPLDLDLAFLDAEGGVLAIHHLERYSEELVAPGVLYLYALEMPEGWFAINGAGVGARFLILDTVQGLSD